MNTIQAQVTLLNLRNKDKNRYFLWTPGWTEWIPLARFLESDQTYFVVAPAPMPTSSPHRPPPSGSDDDFEVTKTVKANRPDDEVTAIIHPVSSTDEGFTEILPEQDSHQEKKTDYGYYHEDFSAEKIDPDAAHKVKMQLPSGKKPSGRDRREFERHNLKIEVIMINKSGRTFRTHSRNISIGGTLLEEELPKEFINTRFDLIIINRFEKDPAKGRLHFQGRVVGDYSDPRRLMFLDADRHTLKKLEEMLKSYLQGQAQARRRPA